MSCRTSCVALITALGVLWSSGPIQARPDDAVANRHAIVTTAETGGKAKALSSRMQLAQASGEQKTAPAKKPVKKRMPRTGHVCGPTMPGTYVHSIDKSTTCSDIQLKRDVVLLRHLDNGLGIYRYRYNWSDQVYVGVMAQEVAQVVPDAVTRGPDGYLRVDYEQLGLRLMTWDQWTHSRR
jgi:hypothetical protein